MLRNYVIVALRTLLRNKGFTLIKITSLSVGMVCFAIISLFVYHELQYDRFHKNSEQIYRVVKDFVNDDGTVVPDATTPPALAPALAQELPEVASVTRIFPGWGRKILLQVGDARYYEEHLMRIDKSFFEVFSFPFVKGEKETALSNPNAIVLTESAARRYFKEEDPIGKAIKIEFGPNGRDFFVTGVLKDVPETSHFTFDFLISVRSWSDEKLDTYWDWYNFYTYVRLKPEADAQAFINKLQPLFKRHDPESKNQYYAQAITDIHLKSKLKWELGNNGDESYLVILATIALFVIVLAAINYINLVTAQSAKRAKEVGIRKVSGALNNLLVRQFLLESVILALTATFLSIAVAEAILPLFSDLFGTRLSLFEKQYLPVLGMLTTAGLVTGVLAGIYPAFYLSSFKPVNVLKGAITQGSHGAFLRQGLVTFQFCISTCLIVGTMVISGQIDFIRSKNIGFDKENILIVNNTGRLQNRQALAHELANVKGVSNVGAADGMLGGQNWSNYIRATEGEKTVLLNFLCTDHKFLDVMGVTFKDGRNFSADYLTDSAAIILNEATIQELGLQEPVIGTRLVWGTNEQGHVDTPQIATVIGVLSNFHFTSFHEPIKPFGFILNTQRLNKLFIKASGEDLPTTIAEVEQTWKKFAPDRPLELTFQDAHVAQLYTNEQKFQKQFSYFTFVAIIIACLGLLGLSAYTAQQRTKEIGIRKILGATVLGIAQMLSKDFLKLIVIAIVISIPLAWYVMSQWLQNFAYRMEMSAWIFLSAAGMVIGIALLTVSFQAIKAALANAVDSLRSE